MGFWLFMLFCDLLLPVLLAVVGKWFIKHPPEKINMVYGYRTAMSMKNQDTWMAAHGYCGRFFRKGGIIVSVFTVVVMLFVLGKGENVIGAVGGAVCILQLGLLAGAIVYTECALRKEFDKNGRKKQRIDHVALYVRDLEAARAFFMRYFGVVSNEKYVNSKTGFQSYFLTFDRGGRLEIMTKPGLKERTGGPEAEACGFAHLAVGVGSKEKVDELTARLAGDGYLTLSGPGTTGDGYYESCVEGPEGNRIEITI